MNLGSICLWSAVAIVGAACLIALLVAVAMRCNPRTRRLDPVKVFVVLAGLFLCGGLFWGYEPLFAAWHRAQNTAVPSAGCLSYEPSFWQLYATYRMTRPEFDQWVQQHPWQLRPEDAPSIRERDRTHWEIAEPEAAYASPAAPNGCQLRVYFLHDTMYVSYNVM